MKPEPIEQLLAAQPLRPPPAEWRADILAAAAAVSARPPISARRAPAAIAPAWSARLRDWLWPSPVAWGGLAAAWIAVFGLELAAPALLPRPAVADVSLPNAASLFMSPGQQQIMARLIESAPTAPAEPPRRPAAGPRSESRRITLAA